MWSIVHGCLPQTPPPWSKPSSKFHRMAREVFMNRHVQTAHILHMLNKPIAAFHRVCGVHICSPRCSSLVFSSGQKLAPLELPMHLLQHTLSEPYKMEGQSYSKLYQTDSSDYTQTITEEKLQRKPANYTY